MKGMTLAKIYSEEQRRLGNNIGLVTFNTFKAIHYNSNCKTDRFIAHLSDVQEAVDGDGYTFYDESKSKYRWMHLDGCISDLNNKSRNYKLVGQSREYYGYSNNYIKYIAVAKVIAICSDIVGDCLLETYKDVEINEKDLCGTYSTREELGLKCYFGLNNLEYVTNVVNNIHKYAIRRIYKQIGMVLRESAYNNGFIDHLLSNNDNKEYILNYALYEGEIIQVSSRWRNHCLVLEIEDEKGYTEFKIVDLKINGSKYSSEDDKFDPMLCIIHKFNDYMEAMSYLRDRKALCIDINNNIWAAETLKHKFGAYLAGKSGNDYWDYNKEYKSWNLYFNGQKALVVSSKHWVEYDEALTSLGYKLLKRNNNMKDINIILPFIGVTSENLIVGQ